jgi:tripartite-type tricarboxylate transporter receptor subunit TctC
MSRRALLRDTVAFAAVFEILASPCAAAETWPTRPMTMVIPYAAGGTVDPIGRVLAAGLSQALGQQVIVENVGGAGGTLGMTRAAQARPDGYTIAVGNMGTQSAAPALYPHLKYDPEKSFAQVGIVNFTPQAIVAKKATAAANLKEFISYLKANHANLSYGHAGVGSIAHVSGLLFNSRLGLKPNLIPYRGTGPALQDLVAGQIDMIVDQASNSLAQVQAGKIKAYAITDTKRLAVAPDIPTADEAGLPNFHVSLWSALWAPKGTPKEVIAKLNAAVMDALADPVVRQRLADVGLEIPPRERQTPQALGAHQKAEIEKWWPIIKAANIKPE